MVLVSLEADCKDVDVHPLEGRFSDLPAKGDYVIRISTDDISLQQRPSSPLEFSLAEGGQFSLQRNSSETDLPAVPRPSPATAQMMEFRHKVQKTCIPQLLTSVIISRGPLAIYICMCMCVCQSLFILDFLGR